MDIVEAVPLLAATVPPGVPPAKLLPDPLRPNPDELDAVVVVASDVQKRIERAVLKGMGTHEEIVLRIATQWPQEKLIARADYVIFNKESLYDLKKETENLYCRLLAAAVSACNPL